MESYPTTPAIFQRGKVWYLRYTDTDGKRVTKRLSTDKRVAEQLARSILGEQDRIKEGWISAKDLAIRDHEARSVLEHLDDWRKDMLAKSKTTKHVDLYHRRAGALLALGRGATFADVDPGRRQGAQEQADRRVYAVLSRTHFSHLRPEAIQAALWGLRDCGKARETVNHYFAAARAFSRWCIALGRARDDFMRGVEAPGEGEPCRPRRALTDHELSLLIDTAGNGLTRYGMPGHHRAMAYKVASATGFRVSELRSLTPESFKLEGPAPSILLRASSTKNRRPADQPISLALAAELNRWLAGSPPGSSVFPLHHETSKAIKADLEACGVPYVTDEGTADFHSLRAYYVSALVRSGASIAEFRQLARHAKPETSLKHYAKVSRHDLRSVVESLPELDAGQPIPQSECMQATGTDATDKRPFAPSLRREGDVSDRNLSHGDMMEETHEAAEMEGSSLNSVGLPHHDASKRRGRDSAEGALEGTMPQGVIAAGLTSTTTCA
jgi:integrase